MGPATVLGLCLLAGTQEDPPTLEYGDQRVSSGWVSMPDGTNVAVDRGVEWRGVKVYLSLTGELIGVDTKSEATLWGHHVGAFWQKLSFAEFTLEDGSAQWCVEMAPSSRTEEGAEARRHHRLRTGAKFTPAAEDTKKPGEALKVRHWTSPDCPFGEPFRVFVSTAAHWAQVRARLCPEQPPEGLDEVDFDEELVLVFALGEVTNCRGMYPVEARRIDDTLRLRMARHTFQTIGHVQPHKPWTAVVLPRHEGSWVVEHNVQGYKNGPELWRSFAGWEQRPSAEKELEPMPKTQRRRGSF